MPTPAISVILPVYNGKPYLEASIKSLLAQELEEFELLILDDCSTDGSMAYLEGLHDHRIRLFKNESNKGLFYNLNLLAKKTTTPLIKLWSQDDIMYPSCLYEFVEFFRVYPQVGFAYSGIHNIDENGNVKQKDYGDDTPQIISTDLHARIAFFTGSIAGNIANVCISKKAMEQVGMFNEGMKISADFDMWVRLAKNHDTGFIPQKLVQLRDHDKQLSRNASLYINHVKEDMIVYRNLLSYVSPSIAKEGRRLLRNHKFVFYYTLMAKEIGKGNFKNAFLFYSELSKMGNFIKLSFAFVKAKLFKPAKPAFLK